MNRITQVDNLLQDLKRKTFEGDREAQNNYIKALRRAGQLEILAEFMAQTGRLFKVVYNRREIKHPENEWVTLEEAQDEAWGHDGDAYIEYCPTKTLYLDPNEEHQPWKILIDLSHD